MIVGLSVVLHASASTATAEEVEKMDPSKMTLKELRAILSQRGVSCDGCIEKADYVKKVIATKDVKPPTDL